MDEDEDDYEKIRLENMRANAELMESLGLGSEKKPKPTSASLRARASKRSPSEMTPDAEPSRSSSRLADRPRRSYNESDTNKEMRKQMSQPKREKPPPREGFRKSARHAEGRKRYEEVDTDDSEGGDAWAPSSSREGSDEEGGSSKSRRVRRRRDAQSRGSIMHTNALSYTDVLKRLKNPTAPGGDPVGNGDPNAESDEEGNDFPRQPLPSREPPRDGKQGKGTLIFENANRHFRPNVTPEEMLRGGVFGGTAFRPYRSAVLHRKLESTDDLSEFPESWYTELDASHELTSPDYDPSVNRYGVKAGQTLEEWENNGWIKRQDPRGWWQWYFRFYQGRRSKDDARQIGRWQKACGPAGRFKRSLVSKIVRSHATWDDESVSPVVRQTLFHWAYELTESDYEDYLPDAS